MIQLHLRSLLKQLLSENIANKFFSNNKTLAFIQSSQFSKIAQIQFEKITKGNTSYMNIENNLSPSSYTELAKLITNQKLLSKYSHLSQQEKSKKLQKIIEGQVTLIRNGQFNDQSRAEVDIDERQSKVNKEQQLDDDLLVFYNPVSIFERDITLLLVYHYIEELKESCKKEGSEFKGVKIFNGLVDSGVRTFRSLKELDGRDICYITACDSYEQFTDYMNLMADINKIDGNKLKIRQSDPNDVLFEHKLDRAFQDKFDIIDLEPHGSSLQYIDCAIRAVQNGGLICATFTDLNTLCGQEMQKCSYFYGSARSKISAIHENAIRIVYYTINQMANKHFKFITPILSLSSDFYLKVYFKVNKSKLECSNSLSKYSHVYSCTECPNFVVHPLGVIQNIEKGLNNKLQQCVPNIATPKSLQCEMCDSKMKINGPIWSAQINDLHFINKMHQTLKMVDQKGKLHINDQVDLFLQSKLKIDGILTAILRERELSLIPLSHNFSKISKFMGVAKSPTKLLINRAFENQGYKVQRSYIYKDQYKTNAPSKLIFDLIKGWKKISSKKEDYLKNIQVNEASHRFLMKRQEFYPKFKKLSEEEIKAQQINSNESEEGFDYAIPEDKPLFFPNPTSNWGPQPRIQQKKKLTSGNPQTQNDAKQQQQNQANKDQPSNNSFTARSMKKGETVFEKIK